MSPEPAAAPVPPPAAAPRTPWLELSLLALAAGLDALVRLGRIHPDEVFQCLEPAMLKAFGFGVVAWEWQVGLRNWAVPGFFALLLKAAAGVGINDAFARRVVLEVPQLALHLAMLGAVYRLAVRRVEPRAARLSVWLVGLYAPLVWFGGRTMSESFSTAFLVWGLERLDRPLSRAGSPSSGVEGGVLTPTTVHPERSRGAIWPALLGGVLLGLAQVTRYGSAAAILPAMLWLLVSRRFKDFGLAAAGGLVVALGLGLLDRLTWGAWFHSFIQYVQFNVLTHAAAERFGANPWYDYAFALYVAPWAVVGLALWVWHRESRAWLLVASAVGYLGIVTVTAHKEPRFIYPALILLAVAGAPAFAHFALAAFDRRAWVKVALAAATIAGAFAYFVVPTPFDVQRPEQFQLILRAGRESTGFVMMPEGVWGSGGFFYVGKPIPWFPNLGPCDYPEDLCFAYARQDARFNRAIVYDPGSPPTYLPHALEAFQAIGFHEVERRGPAHYLARDP